MITTNYQEFLRKKSQLGGNYGFVPIWLPSCLMGFQEHLDSWAIRRGRASLNADCGMGKGLMSLVWAENCVRHTNGRTLIIAPLAVSQQFQKEGEKFGVACKVSRDGRLPAERIVVTNYEMINHFAPSDFTACVCDEAGILKNFTGSTRKRVTRFLSKMRYRLLCTATPSPNDYIELGTAAEALGEIGYSEMLRRFFAYLDDKAQKRERRKQVEAEAAVSANPNYFKKLAFRVSQTIGQWRLRPHASGQFWRWVASWSRVCRKPSDLGFSDDGFDLPPLTEEVHVIRPETAAAGKLYTEPAVGLYEEREERRRTLKERCDKVAILVDHDQPAVVWCHTNDEADRLVEVIPGAEQIAGRTPDHRKVELYEAFASGQFRVLVIKPKIGAWGLNWQHCNHVVTFATHSYEQHYQAVRRCWRFGQQRPVKVDVVATEGEERVLDNLRDKQRKADAMFTEIVREMNNVLRIERENQYTRSLEVPSWL